MGSYCEQVFTPGGTMIRLMGPGMTRYIGAYTIHRITQLYGSEVWTLVKAGPVVHQWRHYPELAA